MSCGFSGAAMSCFRSYCRFFQLIRAARRVLMIGRLKDFCRLTRRYGRNAENFLSVLCVAATNFYWL